MLSRLRKNTCVAAVLRLAPSGAAVAAPAGNE
jgi:hypothetical protein